MWEGYSTAVEAILPDAAIVIDRFHVACHYRDAVDELRKQEVQRLKKELPKDAADDLKHTLWPFRKPAADRDPVERARLDTLLAYSPALRQAYALRDQYYESMALPRGLHRRVAAKLDVLRDDPGSANGDAKKLKGYRNVYRVRVGGYRILYSIGGGWVKLLSVRKRDESTYEDDIGDIILPDQTPDAASLDPQTISPAPAYPLPTHVPAVPEPLPVVTALPIVLTSEILEQLQIPAEHHPVIAAVQTADDLLDLPIPASYAERILDHLFPPPIGVLERQPEFVLAESTDIERFAEESLSAFLLRRSPQQEILRSFGDNGPALVKGGPGSGKSTLALYRNVFDRRAREEALKPLDPSYLLQEFDPPRPSIALPGLVCRLRCFRVGCIVRCANLPGCRGRRPHLRDFEETPCPSDLRPILLGASNLWFGDAITALAIPSDENRLDQMVEERWNQFEDTPDLATLERERKKYPGAFTDFITIPSAEIWAAIERKRARDVRAAADDPSDLKGPEWERFTHPEQQQPTRDFQLRAVTIPPGFETTLDQVVLVERLREVRALLGFTRIDAPGELGEGSDGTQARRARLTRGSSTWMPAVEVRGEGIFIQVREVAIQRWLSRGVVDLRNAQFEESHMVWRRVRNIEPLEAGYPGMRYVLLHTFAHALMRQLVLECGYTAASIRERIYARGSRENLDRLDPMAGILIYTAAPDSEDTLGGLVSLGEPESLACILTGALFDASICTSDPLCAEHAPDRQGISVHGAACHSCQFAPETSCERGNKYLDRSVLVPTFNQHDLAFFEAPS